MKILEDNKISNAAFLIVGATVLVVTIGFSVLFFLNRELALDEKELRFIDKVVLDQLKRVQPITTVTREKSLYKITRIGESKSGYFTYSALSSNGRAMKWRAFWSIQVEGGDPVVSRIEPLSD